MQDPAMPSQEILAPFVIDTFTDHCNLDSIEFYLDHFAGVRELSSSCLSYRDSCSHFRANL